MTFSSIRNGSGSASLSKPERRVLLDQVWRQRCLLCVRGITLAHSSEPKAICSVGKRFPRCADESGGFELRDK